jgi:DNA-binding LacI/PurR family transcriptional regulator
LTRRPTIKDVARNAGVSTVTVSRVTNAPASVQPATRERVLRVMRELGYVPNLAARAMRTNATRSVGILVPDLVSHSNAAVAQAAERHLAAAGYSLLVASSDYRTDHELRALEVLRTRRVDGILLYVSDETDPAITAALARLDMPLVVLDRSLDVAADTLFSDHAPAMELTVSYLASLGHTRLALLMPAIRIRPGLERARAFVAAVAAAGLDPTLSVVERIAPEDHDRPQAAQALFQRPAPPTAVIATGSRLVRSVIATARAGGLSIPGDLSLVAVDAEDIASATSPELTTINRDYAEIGRTAVELLLARIADPHAPPRRIVLDSQVVLKGSCAAPPAGSLSTNRA